MFVSPIEFGSPLYDQSVSIRNEILRKPLGLVFQPTDLSQEFDSYHLAIFDSSYHMLGSLILKPISQDVLKMRQVAIIHQMQGKGVGSRLVSYAEQFGKKRSFQWIELHARKKALNFYTKHNYDVEGSVFKEVGLDHYKMTKAL